MSDSSFIPERQLVFSPALAATIGLEESILLQQLSELFKHRAADVRNGFAWLSVERRWLLENLPFWSAVDLHRISKSLADKGVILIGSPPLHESELFLFAVNESGPGERKPAQKVESLCQQRGANLIAESWTPGEDTLARLAMHNVPRQFALDQLEEFVLYWKERRAIRHAWDNTFQQTVLRAWRKKESESAPGFAPEPADTPISKAWRPSEDAMEILLRAEINSNFIEDAIPEFILYWSEKQETIDSLNSKFIRHIRLLWQKLNNSMQYDTEPRQIPDNWQPSEDVFDMLRMSHIDEEFARELLPEFVLYWRDTHQIFRSWNSKFLQHVKYHWAGRHQFNTGLKNEGQQRIDPAGRTRDRSLADDLTDRSWAN